MNNLLTRINELKKNGYIYSQTDGEQTIYNYSKLCTFDKAWDDVTRMSRGLILDNEGNIIARPFKKFFNVGELPEVSMAELVKKDCNHIEISDKLDGSLGIIYLYKGEVRLASRGSFTSEQALMGTKILKDKYLDEYTRLFKDMPRFTVTVEIIYPENQIVVNYDKLTDIIITGIINTDTGEELSYEDVVVLAKFYDLPVTQVQEGSLTEVLHLINMNQVNFEGYVLRFTDGTRVKIKTEEYCRLHRIVTDLSEKRIWEALSTGVDLKETIMNVPEEFRDWIEDVRDKLNGQYLELEYSAKDFLSTLDLNMPRKNLALQINASGYPLRSVLFSMLDNKDYSKYIWNHIKPKEKPLELGE